MEVMLAKQGSLSTLKNKDFIFEPKFDGTRVLIYKKGKSVKLINRRDKDITSRYPELKDLWRNIKEDSIIDGELVILGKGNKPDFNLLQEREQTENKIDITLKSRRHPATIFAFDIIRLKNRKLTSLPLLERKRILEKTILPSSKISLTPYSKNGPLLWKRVQKLHMEGIMAKRIESKYHPGERVQDWLKIKNTKTLDAIVMGYTKEKRAISALVLGAYHNKKLIYIGRAGAGLDEGLIKILLSKFHPTKKHFVKAETKKKIKYVKPEIVVEIKYLQITKDLKLRAPVLLRIRNDKKIKDCVI